MQIVSEKGLYTYLCYLYSVIITIIWLYKPAYTSYSAFPDPVSEIICASRTK
jgi:hypothetical protein